MSENPWKHYDAAVKEKTFIDPPLEIKGEKFLFPNSPPAEFGLKFLRLAESHKGRMPTHVALGLIPDIIGKQHADKLAELTTTDELIGIVDDLFEYYGLTSSDPSPAPNRQARRASQKQSSKTSARSKQTSSASTT